MNVIVNILCRNGDPSDPLGLGRHPGYVAEGAEWYGRLARHYAAMGCDVMAMLPHGSKSGERMSSNLNAMDGPTACGLGLVNWRLHADHPDIGVHVYCGWALDRSPEDVEMPEWAYPSRISWKDREQLSDQIERMDRFGWDVLWLDAISGQHFHEGSACAWMDFVKQRSGCAVGGEAFLRGEAGSGDAGAWAEAEWRYDLMAGRPFAALLGPWIEKHDFRVPMEQHDEPWYAWLSGHTTVDGNWWGVHDGAAELLGRVKARGFTRVIIDVADAAPEKADFIRRFLDG